LEVTYCSQLIIIKGRLITINYFYYCCLLESIYIYIYIYIYIGFLQQCNTTNSNIHLFISILISLFFLLYFQYHYSRSFGSFANGFLFLFKWVFHLKISSIIIIFLVTLISHNLLLKLSPFHTRYPTFIFNFKYWDLCLLCVYVTDF